MLRLLERCITLPDAVVNSDSGTFQVCAAAVTNNLDVITRVLTAPQEDAKHLRTGAEWLFDSQAEPNETTALLFASIGLEAVLDAPANEVTARVGDRLAWLLGRTRTERMRIADEYREFYRVRSGLVHGRDRTLNADGRKNGRWGREMLRAVLEKDLQQWPSPAPNRQKKPKRPKGTAAVKKPASRA